MKRELILFVALCAFTAAMVPRERKAVNAEETQTDSSVKYCATTTQCAWTIYKPATREVKETIYNNYCKCAGDTKCYVVEDDLQAGTYVHRCRLPSQVKDIDIDVS